MEWKPCWTLLVEHSDWNTNSEGHYSQWCSACLPTESMAAQALG